MGYHEVIRYRVEIGASAVADGFQASSSRAPPNSRIIASGMSETQTLVSFTSSSLEATVFDLMLC